MSSVTLTFGVKQKLSIAMSPSKTLAQALGEFCSKFDLDANEFFLVHNKKTLDLSLAWRLAGISSNATIEVKKKATSSKQDDSSAAAMISVAVQIDGTRHILVVSSTTTLWTILKTLESDKGINLTSSSYSKKLKDGVIVNYYNQIIVNFLSSEIGSNTELRSSSLRSLGISSGSVLLRVRFKPTEIELNDFLKKDDELIAQEIEQSKAAELKISEAKAAHQQQVEIENEKRAREEQEARLEEEKRKAEREQIYQQVEQKKKEETDRAIEQMKRREEEERQRASSSSDMQTQETQNKPEKIERKKMEIVVEPPGPPGLYKTLLEGGMIDQDHSRLHELLRMQADEIEKANKIPEIPCERQIAVFAPSNTPFDPSRIKIPDDFFELSPEDLMKNASKPTSTSSKNAPNEMKTKAMKEKERLQKLSKFKKCYIRFRFPDRIEVQATFYPQEATNHLIDFVRQELLQDPNLDFYLFTTPPTTKLHDTKNLRDQGFLPAALVQVGLNPGVSAVSPFLKPSILNLITEKNYTPIVTEYKSNTQMTFLGAPQSIQHPSSTSTETRMEVDQPAETSKPAESKKTVPKWFQAGIKKK